MLGEKRKGVEIIEGGGTRFTPSKGQKTNFRKGKENIASFFVPRTIPSAQPSIMYAFNGKGTKLDTVCCQVVQ